MELVVEPSPMLVVTPFLENLVGDADPLGFEIDERVSIDCGMDGHESDHFLGSDHRE